MTHQSADNDRWQRRSFSGRMRRFNRHVTNYRKSLTRLVGTVLVASLMWGCTEEGQTRTTNETILTIGSAEEPQTLDPQYGLFGQIQQATFPAVFEPLFFRELDGKTIYPLLAEGYQFIDPLTVQINLKQGLVFSDGTEFNADDVVFTLNRLADPPGASIPIKYVTDAIANVVAIDPFKVTVHLNEPTPNFIGYLMEVPMLSAQIGDAAPADFNKLDAAIGTGPYKFAEWRRGDMIEYVRNPYFRDEPAPWEKVVLKFIPNHAARVAALLAGDIDLTNYIPTTDVKRLERAEDVTVTTVPANRALYFHIDIERGNSPFVTAKNGQPIENPLKDVRVRRALSLAIDRDLIVEKILDGYASPAAQWIAPGYIGHEPTINDVTPDRSRARQLLIEAGFSDGFAMTLHGTAGLYGPDRRILQAMAAMWEKIGLKVEVDAIPAGVYWGRWANREFSVSLSSYGLQYYRTAPIVSVTLDTDGYDNIGGYSNSQVDLLLAQANAAHVSDQQEQLASIARITADDVALLPIYHFKYVFGYRSDRVSYQPTHNVRDLEILNAAPIAQSQVTQVR
ncbi:MAG: ABC transporter substrate-binding protein [Pseudomonadota bacterium]